MDWEKLMWHLEDHWKKYVVVALVVFLLLGYSYGYVPTFPG